MRLSVISDLHVGSGPLDDCDAVLESALVEFLAAVSDDATPTTLVINGDFLDFAQAEPWKSKDLESTTADGRIPLCFTEEQSLEKFRGIVRAHRPIFEALGRLTTVKSRHRVVVLPGNHDADLFWDRVREEFAATLGKGDGGTAPRLTFHLDPMLCPAEFAGVWIEHGHQYDACNRFVVDDVPHWSEQKRPIYKDKAGVPRLLECVGTRFMINFLNGLDRDYPFVDNVKPFSKFIRMFLVSAAKPGFGPLRAVVAYWGFLRFFAVTLGKSPRDLMSDDKDEQAALPVKLAERLGDLSRSQRESVVSALMSAGFDFKGMPLDFYIGDTSRAVVLLDFLVGHPEIVDQVHGSDAGLLSAGDAGYMTLGLSYLQDETAALKSAAKKILSGGASTTVIMGHTHEPVDPLPTLNYVNIGSWTRYFRQKIGDKTPRSWQLLKTQASFPYELAYAAVDSGAKGHVTRRIFRSEGG